ncbi:helix-turn-helix domain-containing protein [Streptomyces kroppenstedtii]|uniref:helix-turn-helix domain-containing protein n=1 Tax=Streptomyces kroppenstedtii TaxID=3051181 RepID=UPI0028D6A295|nr:helix-turn-helix transcriptional regulator [Streptomyces sp. DSM 40484]
MLVRAGTGPSAGATTSTDDQYGGTVATRDEDVEEFAALLRRLKARTDRSYGALARRVNMNTSTLHRYCAGDAVPLDFAPVERFAALCGATPEERLELHRRWILAVAARQRPRTPGPSEAPATDTAEEAAAEATEDTAADGDAQPSEAVPALAARPRPSWYRRRITVTVAAASALLLTLGSLSALSGDRSSDDASGSVRPSPTTATSDARHRASTSPSPSGSSPSASTTGKASESPGSGGPSRSKGAKDTKGTKQKADGGAAVSAPLTWTANSQAWKLGCGHDYVIRKDPGQVPPPPAPQDAGTWAATQGAVHGRQTNVEISVQGRTSTAVVLTDLRVRVVGRTAPDPGIVYAMDQGCGGSITPRSFAVDLDKDRPIARAVPGNDTGTPIPAVRMPYRVSASDPEVLLVEAQTETCGCDWYLELDWSSEGRTGTVRIDDHGRPFRTSAIKGLPRYWYGTEGSERKWVPAD